jgi:hypothetical protein
MLWNIARPSREEIVARFKNQLAVAINTAGNGTDTLLDRQLVEVLRDAAQIVEMRAADMRPISVTPGTRSSLAN